MRFKVGDKVKVVNAGKCYSNYNEWVYRYVKFEDRKYWDNALGALGKCNRPDDVYTILAKRKHTQKRNSMLYYIQSDKTKKCYLIGEQGIELVKGSDNMVDKMFKEISEMVEKGELKISNKMLSNKNGEITFTIDFISNKKEILDKEEKRYLSNVIRPFRDKIEHIIKLNYNNREYIKIRMYDDLITLPYFKIGTMYKGMKNAKEYTLEELGL